MTRRPFYYENVPQLGAVAISRHAQARMDELGVTTAQFEEALFRGELLPEGHAITWRELKGVRVVIVNRPEPFSGAKLVKTVFRIKGQEKT